MRENYELRASAKEQLKGSWLPAAGLTLLYSVLAGISMPFCLVLGGPLECGFAGYFLRKARGEKAEIENLFDGFNMFGRSFLLYILRFALLFLWTLLLIVPGIIKSFSYSMSWFILRDNPDMSSLEALSASRAMMHGRKWKLFLLYLSFIGWALLCIPTFGIGCFWLIPYIKLSTANFYEDIKSTISP